MSFFRKIKQDAGLDEKGSAVSTKSQGGNEENIGGNSALAGEKITEVKAKSNEQKGKDSKNEAKAAVFVKNRSSDWMQSKGQLAVDVYQTDSAFCVQAPIAGVEQEDLDIFIENEMLIIKGARKEPSGEEEKQYFHQECYWGPFARQIIVPEDADCQRIKAALKKGILIIKIPRRKTEKKKVVVEIEQ